MYRLRDSTITGTVVSIIMIAQRWVILFWIFQLGEFLLFPNFQKSTSKSSTNSKKGNFFLFKPRLSLFLCCPENSTLSIQRIFRLKCPHLDKRISVFMKATFLNFSSYLSIAILHYMYFVIFKRVSLRTSLVMRIYY